MILLYNENNMSGKNARYTQITSRTYNTKRGLTRLTPPLA